MSKIHGRATIRINGQVYETDDDATLQPGGLKNNERMTGDKFFYNQTNIPSKLTCKLPVTREVSLRELQEINEAEITFASDNGRTWIIRNAAQTGDVQVQGGADNGKVELTFHGEPAEEMMA
jgi:Phage tail tube protein